MQGRQRLAARLGLAATVLALAMSLASAGGTGPITPERVRSVLAPAGRLRAAINYGNTVLAQRSATGELSGVSVDLARELAGRLDLPLDLVPFDAAGKVTASASQDVWDVAFLAIDPVRAGEIDFTPPYLQIEGTYLVRQDSPVRTIDDADREGAQIAVGRGSAYDLFLTRAIRRASLVRATTSADALQLFVDQKLDAAAGVKQPLVVFAHDHPEFRVVEGRFMSIDQAMGVPRGRAEALGYLTDFVEEMKASGVVAAALDRHRQTDAVVAPPLGR